MSVRIPDNEDRLDVTQEAWVRTWRNVPRNDGGRSVRDVDGTPRSWFCINFSGKDGEETREVAVRILHELCANGVSHPPDIRRGARELICTMHASTPLGRRWRRAPVCRSVRYSFAWTASRTSHFARGEPGTLDGTLPERGCKAHASRFSLLRAVIGWSRAPLRGSCSTDCSTSVRNDARAFALKWRDLGWSELFECAGTGFADRSLHSGSHREAKRMSAGSGTSTCTDGAHWSGVLRRGREAAAHGPRGRRECGRALLQLRRGSSSATTWRTP